MSNLKITCDKIRKSCDDNLVKEKYNIIKDIPNIGIRHLFDGESHEYKTNTLPDKILILQILSDINKCSFYDLITAYVKDNDNFNDAYRIDGTTFFLLDFMENMETINLPIANQIKKFILNREWENWITILKKDTYNHTVEYVFSYTLTFYMRKITEKD